MWQQTTNISTQYTSYDDPPMQTKTQVKVLDILMNGDAAFEDHVLKSVQSTKNKWYHLGITNTHPDQALLIHLLKHCCQLWSQYRVQEEQAMEAVRHIFSSRIPSVQHLGTGAPSPPSGEIPWVWRDHKHLACFPWPRPKCGQWKRHRHVWDHVRAKLKT